MFKIMQQNDLPLFIPTDICCKSMMAVRLVSITTDLHSLCIKGDLKTINESWTKYSDQLENCKSGFTPLHEAARKGHTGIVEFLISKGARVNALSKKKETALYYAAGGKHTECEIVLIDNKANVRIGEITPLGSEDGEFIKMLTFQGKHKFHRCMFIDEHFYCEQTSMLALYLNNIL